VQTSSSGLVCTFSNYNLVFASILCGIESGLVLGFLNFSAINSILPVPKSSIRNMGGAVLMWLHVACPVAGYRLNWLGGVKMRKSLTIAEGQIWLKQSDNTNGVRVVGLSDDGLQVHCQDLADGHAAVCPLVYLLQHYNALRQTDVATVARGVA
jgi:hypothetical protein